MRAKRLVVTIEMVRMKWWKGKVMGVMRRGGGETNRYGWVGASGDEYRDEKRILKVK